MVIRDGHRDGRIIESAIGRYGETVSFRDGTDTEAVPNYEDGLVELRTGEVRHLEGWSLVFRPSFNIPVNTLLKWRDKYWKVTDTKPQITKLWCMLSGVPEPDEAW